MALIDLFAISKQFDSKQLLSNVDFHLHAGERVAIIGQNGCGKSTLMKIAAGQLSPDEGKRIIGGEVQIEMLSQMPDFREGLTVKMAIESELHEIKQIQTRYSELSVQISTDFDNKSLQKQLDDCTQYLDHHNAWTLDNKIEQILTTFNLKSLENQLINQLSGGEQRRVALASLILKKPDVLILDEPTNHLDVYMVRFLEDFILRENFTLLFVSHDRYFIDKIATQIVEVEQYQLKKYVGGYGDFLRQKEASLGVLEKQQHNMEKLLKSELTWLNRGVKARTKRNMGRVRRVQELKGQVGKETSSLIRKMRSELMREQIQLTAAKGGNSKRIFFDIYNLCYRIGERQLIDKFKAKILQKERIAIVGNNGTGKSTLLKLLTGELQPDSGNIKCADIKIGYFDQSRSELDPDQDLIATFCPQGGDLVEVQGKSRHVYGYLKSFNFPPEDLTKRIGMLSGGERNRIALAKLFTQQVDCLILDEPTNDLDIQTINILEEKLQEFAGVIILVSHDRYFVDKIAEKLFIFQGNGDIEVSHQSYSEYLDIEETLQSLTELEKTVKTPASANNIASNISPDTSPATGGSNSKKLSYKDQLALAQLPDEISELEHNIAQLLAELEQNSSDAEKVTTLSTELGEWQQHLEDKEARYFELLEQSEA